MTKVNPISIAAYGGSFNPPTLGHYHLIKKAATIFDRVYVVLAKNGTKKSESMFTDEERMIMLKDMATDINLTVGTEICVVLLPSNVYLANYAEQLGAKFLIRGIRDQIDFGYEQNIYRTNRLIQPKIETIYLMPDDAYSIVSSSWVKSLVGCNGWTKVVKDSVTPLVLHKLKESYLKGIFMEIANGPLKELIDSRSDEIWERITKNYGPREYHGFDHLLTFIENLKKVDCDPDPLMMYAIFMHDIDPSEDESIKIALSYIYEPDVNTRFIREARNARDKVKLLINATKHVTCDYETEEERLIATMDLLTLAIPYEEYKIYTQKVFEENLMGSGMQYNNFIPIWKVGRSDFLKKMLARRVIFPAEYIGQHLELLARENMQKELDSYEN